MCPTCVTYQEKSHPLSQVADLSLRGRPGPDLDPAFLDSQVCATPQPQTRQTSCPLYPGKPTRDDSGGSCCQWETKSLFALQTLTLKPSTLQREKEVGHVKEVGLVEPHLPCISAVME